MRVGSHNLYSEDPDQADIAVSKVLNHEEYDSWTISNDICMLHLDGAADLSSSVIDTIAIPSSGQEYPSGHICTVSGWGTTSEGGSLARQLMKVTLGGGGSLSVTHCPFPRSMSPLSLMMTAVTPMARMTSLTLWSAPVLMLVARTPAR